MLIDFCSNSLINRRENFQKAPLPENPLTFATYENPFSQPNEFLYFKHISCANTIVNNQRKKNSLKLNRIKN